MATGLGRFARALARSMPIREADGSRTEVIPPAQAAGHMAFVAPGVVRAEEAISRVHQLTREGDVAVLICYHANGGTLGLRFLARANPTTVTTLLTLGTHWLPEGLKEALRALGIRRWISLAGPHATPGYLAKLRAAGVQLRPAHRPGWQEVELDLRTREERKGHSP